MRKGMGISAISVTSCSTDNMNDVSGELNDLEHTSAAFGSLTTFSLKAYIQCTQGLAVTMLDLPLPVTSDDMG